MTLHLSDKKSAINALDAISSTQFRENDSSMLFIAIRDEAKAQDMIALRDIGNFAAHSTRTEGKFHHHASQLQKILTLMVENYKLGSTDIPNIFPKGFNDYLKHFVAIMPDWVIRNEINKSKRKVKREISENFTFQPIDNEKCQLASPSKDKITLIRKILFSSLSEPLYSQNKIMDDLRIILEGTDLKRELEERIMLGIIAFLHGKDIKINDRKAPLIAFIDSSNNILLAFKATVQDDPVKPLAVLIKFIQTDLSANKIDSSALMQYSNQLNVDPNIQLTIACTPTPRIRCY